MCLGFWLDRKCFFAADGDADGGLAELGENCLVTGGERALNIPDPDRKVRQFPRIIRTKRTMIHSHGSCYETDLAAQQPQVLIGPEMFFRSRWRCFFLCSFVAEILFSG